MTTLRIRCIAVPFSMFVRGNSRRMHVIRIWFNLQFSLGDGQYLVTWSLADKHPTRKIFMSIITGIQQCYRCGTDVTKIIIYIYIGFFNDQPYNSNCRITAEYKSLHSLRRIQHDIHPSIIYTTRGSNLFRKGWCGWQFSLRPSPSYT